MRTLPVILFAALALGACDSGTPVEGTPAEQPSATVPAAEPALGMTADEAPTTPDVSPATSERLPVGEYRVAGADGADVNLPHGIGVSVGADTIAVSSQCVTPRWTYRYEGGRLLTEPIHEPICDRGRYPAEEALSAVFDDPQTIVRTPANGIEISGGGHTVTLFSQ